MGTLFVPRTFGGTLLLTTDPVSLPATAPVSLLFGLLAGVPITPFAGAGIIVPLFLPQPLRYAVAGIPLMDQPVITTGPIATSGLIPAGTSFTLLWSNPSAGTQTALATGTTVSLTFAVTGGQYVTGLTQLVSSLTNGMFQVQCTLPASLLLSTPGVLLFS